MNGQALWPGCTYTVQYAVMTVFIVLATVDSFSIKRSLYNFFRSHSHVKYLEPNMPHSLNKLIFLYVSSICRCFSFSK